MILYNIVYRWVEYMNKSYIAKKVFSYIGHKDVNIDDKSDFRVKIFDMYYEPVKIETLRSKIWKFAVYKEPATLTSINKGKFIYKFPEDCLHVVNKDSVNFNEVFIEDLGFRVILTPNKIKNIYYIKKLKDEDILNTKFIKAFCLSFASVLAIGINNDSRLADKLDDKFQKLIGSGNLKRWKYYE